MSDIIYTYNVTQCLKTVKNVFKLDVSTAIVGLKLMLISNKICTNKFMFVIKIGICYCYKPVHTDQTYKNMPFLKIVHFIRRKQLFPFVSKNKK